MEQRSQLVFVVAK